VELARCAPNQLLRDCFELLSYKMRAQGVTLAADLDPVLSEIQADPAGLQQVFVNLVINALDAMPRGGQLGVRTWLDGSNGTAQCGIEISDTGTGITSVDSDRIFDPFFTTKPSGQGTGLGLSVSLAIVEGHGGRIEVRSEPGRGSAFTVLLPISGRS
jgi:signal transduction histidine kinase